VWCTPRRREEAGIRILEPRERQAPNGGQSGGMKPTDRSRITRRIVLAPAFPGHRGPKHHENLKNLLPTLDLGRHSNARFQLLPEAGAQRTL
jgi:hypothetical protein